MLYSSLSQKKSYATEYLALESRQTSRIKEVGLTTKKLFLSLLAKISRSMYLSTPSWKDTLQRQLSATVAIHDTIDILNPKYIPPADHSVAWDQRQMFMFNILRQCILSSKRIVSCVRQYNEARRSMNAQRFIPLYFMYIMTTFPHL